MPLISLDKIGLPQMDPIGQMQAGFQQGYQNELAKVDSELAQRKQGMAEQVLGQQQQAQAADQGALYQMMVDMGESPLRARRMSRSQFGMAHLQALGEQRDRQEVEQTVGPLLAKLQSFAGVNELDEEQSDMLEEILKGIAEAKNGAQARTLQQGAMAWMNGVSTRNAALPQMREAAVAQARSVLTSFAPMMANPVYGTRLLNALIALHQAESGVVRPEDVMDTVLGALAKSDSSGELGGKDGEEMLEQLKQMLEPAPQPAPQQWAPQNPAAGLLQGAQQAATQGPAALQAWAESNGLDEQGLADLLSGKSAAPAAPAVTDAEFKPWW